MSDKKVLLLLYPDCVSFEAMLTIEILGQTYPVDVITSNDERHTDTSGLQIQPQFAFEKVAIDDYVALIVPGVIPMQLLAIHEYNSLFKRFIMLSCLSLVSVQVF